MCSEQFKIDRLEQGMSDMNTRVSVLETKLDDVIDSLKELRADRKHEFDRIIQALEEAKDEAVAESKDLENGIKNRKWAVIMSIITAVLSLLVVVMGSILANFM